MTTFAEMRTLVTTETRKPELVDVTTQAIKTATLRAHHTDFFPRDLRSDTSQILAIPSASLFADIINIGTVLPRLRSIKYIQLLDATTYVPVEKLEYREVDDMYMNGGTRRTSAYNLIGETLRIHPLTKNARADIYFYQNPVTAEDTYQSWIADTYPEQLAKWAAGIVFARTGFAEQAEYYRKVFVEDLKETLNASHLLGSVS